MPAEGVAVPPTVRWMALGVARDNVALVSAQRRDEGTKATVTLRIARLGGPESVEVRVRAQPGAGAKEGTEQRETVKLPLEGAATVRLSFENAGDVEVALPEDALPEDGHARLVYSAARPVRVALAEGLEAPTRQALERFLAVAPEVEIGPGEGALLVGPRGTDARVTVGAGGTLRTYLGPFFSEKGHPLLEDVQLAGVRWTAGANPPGRALITAGETVLLSEEEGRVHLNLELSRSNLQRTVAWPVFWGNVLREARRTREGFPRRQLMLGEPMPVVTQPGARYSLVGPLGEKPVFGAGALSLPAPLVPGRYTLERDGAPVDVTEVLALDARESDLRARSTGTREAEAEEADEEGPGAPGRARWPLLVLLGALLADFYVTRRR
jgi:hypothetical protein